MESLIQHDVEEIEDEVNALDVNNDEAFEFMDIFDKCKKHIAQGYEIQFKTHGIVEKDGIIVEPTVLPGRLFQTTLMIDFERTEFKHDK